MLTPPSVLAVVSASTSVTPLELPASATPPVLPASAPADALVWFLEPPQLKEIIGRSTTNTCFIIFMYAPALGRKERQAFGQVKSSGVIWVQKVGSGPQLVFRLLV